MHDRDIQRAVDQGRHQAPADVQAMLADLITTAEDSYLVNKGTSHSRHGVSGSAPGAEPRRWLVVQQGYCMNHQCCIEWTKDATAVSRDLPMRVVVDEVPVDCGVGWLLTITADH